MYGVQASATSPAGDSNYDLSSYLSAAPAREKQIALTFPECISADPDALHDAFGIRDLGEKPWSELFEKFLEVTASILQETPV